mmetsp:Transcript_39567/g.85466  ORF Transcript_39567/g.85466 Transcript_39567/m.85466 type:complete len:152 (-) Transcript_39567:336-791(-)
MLKLSCAPAPLARRVPRAALHRAPRTPQPVLAFKPNAGAGASRSQQLQESIHNKLTLALQPVSLKIIDESPEPKQSRAAVANGGAAPEPLELHFRVEVVSESFQNLSAVKRQRLVYQLLEEEVTQDLHALALWTKTPLEAAKLQTSSIVQE